MAACGSIVGCMVVDDRSSTRGGSEARFLKPIGVPNGNKTRLRAVRGSCYGGQGGVFQMGRRSMGFTVHQSSKDMKSSIGSSLNFDGVVSEVSRDGSLIYEQNKHMRLLTGGGEAYFISSEDEQVVAVADGVGGWGVNAGDNSQELMSEFLSLISESLNVDADPLLVVQAAHFETEDLGCSTAFIVALKNQNCLLVLDCGGGCGFIVVRDGENLIYKPPIRQHLFKLSYQSNGGDLPSSGQNFEIPVVPGDAIVYGSDGLFEKLSSKEIAAIVGGALNENLSPDATAQRIAVVARERASSSIAGQEDDVVDDGVTVVVSFVSNSTTDAK